MSDIFHCRISVNSIGYDEYLFNNSMITNINININSKYNSYQQFHLCILKFYISSFKFLIFNQSVNIKEINLKIIYK